MSSAKIKEEKSDLGRKRSVTVEEELGAKVAEKIKKMEKRDRMLIKDRSSEMAVLEEVFDKSTLMTIYDFMNGGEIKEIYGVVDSGKESRIYWGIDSAGEEIAIKIFLTVSAEFRKGRLPYILADPRFKNVRKNLRSLVYLWAQKEFKNLKSAYEAKVRVPRPITVKNNVLLMEFIGKNGVSAPLLREVELKSPERTYRTILLHVKRLYRGAELVHGDLSEYNVMVFRGRPVLFDFSQAVSIKHPNAGQFLMRDIENINRYFEKLGVNVIGVEEAYRVITGGAAIR
ncbi:serine protein kinase RIO [Candidatus Bathyarchaeota archaeon]|nr:serine protein kinase RIO [Candidatus Bathyarchaeota archaeon]